QECNQRSRMYRMVNQALVCEWSAALVLLISCRILIAVRFSLLLFLPFELDNEPTQLLARRQGRILRAPTPAPRAHDGCALKRTPKSGRRLGLGASERSTCFS